MPAQRVINKWIFARGTMRLLYLQLKAHFYSTASARKTAFVAEVTHKVNATAATFFEAFKIGGIWHLLWIKSGAFIRYANRQRIFLVAKRNIYCFGAISAVTMQNRICNSFGKGNKNITMCA